LKKAFVVFESKKSVSVSVARMKKLQGQVALHFRFLEDEVIRRSWTDLVGVIDRGIAKYEADGGTDDAMDILVQKSRVTLTPTPSDDEDRELYGGYRGDEDAVGELLEVEEDAAGDKPRRDRSESREPEGEDEDVEIVEPSKGAKGKKGKKNPTYMEWDPEYHEVWAKTVSILSLLKREVD
jgi:hypothetical protein